MRRWVRVRAGVVRLAAWFGVGVGVGAWACALSPPQPGQGAPLAIASGPWAANGRDERTVELGWCGEDVAVPVNEADAYRFDPTRSAVEGDTFAPGDHGGFVFVDPERLALSRLPRGCTRPQARVSGPRAWLRQPSRVKPLAASPSYCARERALFGDDYVVHVVRSGDVLVGNRVVATLGPEQACLIVD